MILRKRKRRPNNIKKALLAPSSMNLRKRVKTNQESTIDAQFSNNTAAAQLTSVPVITDTEEARMKHMGLSTDQPQSASFVRYEIVEKKGQKILVPVRYSIRNQNLDVSFHAKEALQALYQPSEMESLFSMDETA